MSKRKTILIDLDGVLNEYNGSFDPDEIPKPRKNAKKFLKELTKDYKLQLFTTRNKMQAVKWLIEHRLDIYFSDVTNTKELSWLIIDDRCLKFDGSYKSLINDINKFKPWYKNRD